MKHPIQPLFEDDHGTIRFFRNRIVERLLDEGGFDMNDIARWENITNDERMQFAQLIGYSLSGFGELGYVNNDTYNIAERMSKGESHEVATARALMATIVHTRRHVREMAVELFNIHPDDLE